MYLKGSNHRCNGKKLADRMSREKTLSEPARRYMLIKITLYLLIFSYMDNLILSEFTNLFKIL